MRKGRDEAVVKPIQEYSMEELKAHLSDIVNDAYTAYHGNMPQLQIELFTSVLCRIRELSVSIKEGIQDHNKDAAARIIESIDVLCRGIESDIEVLTGDKQKHQFVCVGLEETIPQINNLVSNTIHYHSDLVDYRKKSSRDGKKAKGIQKPLLGIELAISEAIEFLLQYDPESLQPELSDRQKARNVWIALRRDIFHVNPKNNNRINKDYGPFRVSFDPETITEDLFSGTLDQLDTYTHSVRSMKWGKDPKRFTGHVLNALEQFKKT